MLWFTRRQTALYQQVGSEPDFTLGAGEQVQVVESSGRTHFDDGSTRYYAVRSTAGVGWVLASDLTRIHPEDGISTPPPVLASENTSQEPPSLSPPTLETSSMTATDADSETTPPPIGIGMAVNVRESGYAYNQPGRQNVSVDYVLAGMQVSIVDGPREVSGETWWRVLTPKGSDGWLPAPLLTP